MNFFVEPKSINRSEYERSLVRNLLLNIALLLKDNETNVHVICVKEKVSVRVSVLGSDRTHGRV